MAITIKLTGDYEILSDGLHVATISNVEERYFPYYEASKQEREQLKELEPGTREFKDAVAAKKLVRKIVLTWFTDEADSSGNTKEKKQFVGATLGAKSNLRPIVEALSEPGETLADFAADMTILKGRKARLFIKHEEDKEGNVKDKIVDVSRFKAASRPTGGTAAAKAVLAPAAPITDDDIPF